MKDMLLEKDTLIIEIKNKQIDLENLYDELKDKWINSKLKRKALKAKME
jgi:hypothetical protein